MNRDSMYLYASADNYRREGKYLTHEEYERQQNEEYEMFNKRNESGNLRNPHCICGKQNSWSSNFCSNCGRKI